MRIFSVLLMLFMPLWALAAEPQVKVRSQLLPADSVLVGGTLSLQVDLLVDTWFSDAPRLPKLNLDGAVVSEPGGEAVHLNEQIEGTPFFGLRFTYQITPQQARSFEIPALAIQVSPGQGSGPVTVHSQPQRFVARRPVGAEGGEQRLVARQVSVTQTLKRSHEPLRVGDSVERRLHIEAEGAQAMLIPPPGFAEISGLKRYLQSPSVGPLSDGRGGSDGGVRDDGVTYVIAEAGEYRLPAIELHWWDATTGEARTASVPALEIEASAAAGYQAPFSITEDLRELGRKTQVRIAGHWLLLLGALLLVGVLGYAWRSQGAALLGTWKRWRQARRQAWLESPEYAWRQVRSQLESTPAELGALYLWIRRMSGCREMSRHASEFPNAPRNALLGFLGARYGRERNVGATTELIDALPALHRTTLERAEDSSRKDGLKPLNP
ncbi:hypothetical protein H681_12160 [Pseudomonas sp. ATCC 13867]|uniref:BatD family protein n=1 Tax=Pseudomonas sp. ATCC 13867 TaxID=1294143 RepID=UPI0002C4EA84|nr:BatD family protein [Pseudomonas sp. ATCC 13867]AGI24302.1 hypothetical protein H681_12160 [Pseudomonas sp. ATCC 13867]